MLVIGIQNCLDLDARIRTAGKGREGAGRGSTWRILVAGEAPGDGDHGTWGRATAAADAGRAERTRGHGRENMRPRDEGPNSGRGIRRRGRRRWMCARVAAVEGWRQRLAIAFWIFFFGLRMGVREKGRGKVEKKRYKEINRWIILVKGSFVSVIIHMY